MIALTHIVSPHIARCELSHLARRPIDHGRACRQHDAYVQALRDRGCEVIELACNQAYPDSTFIEDTAVVVDECAILASMGAASRRAEVAGVGTCLATYRPVRQVALPATLEGGDVLRVGRHVLVGLSRRTNQDGVDALARILATWDYQVQALPLQGCLHLKSACTTLDAETLLLNPARVDSEALTGYRLVPVPATEPAAANVLALGNTILMASDFPRTAEMVTGLGFEVVTLDISELMKAEAAMTCSSIILD